MKSPSQAVKLILSLALISSGGLVFSFLTQTYILLSIGPGATTDAFFAGAALPQVVLAVITGALAHVLVPFLMHDDEEIWRRNAWGFFLLVGGVFSILGVTLYFTANAWVSRLFPGFSSRTLQLTVELTRIQLLGMLFTALSGVLLGAYHSRKRFVGPDSTLLVSSILGLALTAFVLPRYGIRAVVWVYVLRMALPVLILLPGLGPYTKKSLSKGLIRDAWRQTRPLLIGTSYYKMGPVVDRYFSSLATAGGLSLFNFGQQVFGAASQVASSAIVAPAVPHLAERANEKDWVAYRRTYRRRLVLMIGLTSAAFLVFALAGRLFLGLAAGHGGFTQADANLLFVLLLALGGLLVFSPVGSVLSTGFYAHGDTKTPVIIGIVSFSASLFLKAAGFRLLGLVGLALAGSIHVCLTAIAMYVALERKLANHGAGLQSPQHTD